jgi:hypothetical protein
MSMKKFKAFMNKRKENKEEKELAESRHHLQVLMREKKRMQQHQATENIKKGASTLGHLVGRMTPKNKLEIKSNRPAIRR